jgi:hypothetical protein
MKKCLIVISVLLVQQGWAQEFNAALSTAKTAYSGGKLEETHFALMQAMQELDMIIGREVLKILPVKMENRSAKTTADQVVSNVGFIGATIHRSYGDAPELTEVDIISNSPLIASLNAFLNMPMMGGMMKDANNKTIKVQGYKARLTAEDRSEGGKNYEIQVPLGSALLTFRANNTTEAQATAMVNSLPLQQIAKLIQ